MEFVLGLVIGFFGGGFVGILLMCILQSKNGGENDFLSFGKFAGSYIFFNDPYKKIFNIYRRLFLFPFPILDSS